MCFELRVKSQVFLWWKWDLMISHVIGSKGANSVIGTYWKTQQIDCPETWCSKIKLTETRTRAYLAKLTAFKNEILWAWSLTEDHTNFSSTEVPSWEKFWGSLWFLLQNSAYWGSEVNQSHGSESSLAQHDHQRQKSKFLAHRDHETTEGRERRHLRTFVILKAKNTLRLSSYKSIKVTSQNRLSLSKNHDMY